MRRLSILFRLLSALAAAGIVCSFHGPSAFAEEDEDDDWGDEDEDDDSDDDWDQEEDEDEDGEDDEDQPPVTAGGLYTKKTYPVAELLRPLTVIGGMFEARAGVDIDLSNETAFDTWRGRVEGRYGLKDYIELQFGADFLLSGDAAPPASNQARLVLGAENAIVYDLVDFRAQAEMPINPDAPEGTDSFAFDLAFGFPFRYRYKDKVGLIALDKIMTIHTDGRDPDLTVGIGGIIQIVEPFAVLVRGEVIVPEFNFDGDSVAIPLTAAAQLSPNNKFDLGLEFTFANVKPPDPLEPFDQRFLFLYAQIRL